MASKPQTSNESVKLDGGEFGELSFDWKDDRYQHCWKLSDARVDSVESNGVQLWPVSPPLQQIHQQSFGDGREVVFGVGMSGRGHWSASYTLIPDLKCWIVELACRAPVVAESLASTYRSEEGWSAIEPGRFATTGSSETRLEIEAIEPGSVASLDGQQLVIKPVELSQEPGTTQWAFRLRVSS